jgi:hypothetical protein
VETKRKGCGACTVVVESAAKVLDLTQENVFLELSVAFEEALKLKAAVDEAVRRLNNLDRSPGSRGASERIHLEMKVGAGQQRIIVSGPDLRTFCWPGSQEA